MTTYTKPELNQHLLEDYKGNYVFFYNGYLSNWYMTKFTAPLRFNDYSELYEYNCSEQHMMLQKALLFKDEANAERIKKSDFPGDQKAYGRSVKNFEPYEWNKVSRAIVYEGCYHKFMQNRECYDYLMSTKGKLLVEASPTDNVWGIRKGGYEEDIEDVSTWQGANWLGEVLTLLRENLEISDDYLNPYLYQ